MQRNTQSRLSRLSQTHGIDISFQIIEYSVKIDSTPKKCMCIAYGHTKIPKQILSPISGMFSSGQISAIMGASGSGKTTLLNILACRIPTSGHIYANSLQYTSQQFGSFANYVMQQDLLMETLTVRQTLMFVMDLRVNQSKDEKVRRVREMAKSLMLEKCLDTLVGGVVMKGVSGGEKKRTAIAVELITDPQVVFLDEPTSGLDSLTSYILVTYLRKLARVGKKTIIMTIHQPNSQVFNLIDHLTILVSGRLIYQSPCYLVKSYFQQNFHLKCPQFFNPPDFFISKIHPDNPSNVQRYPQYILTYEQKQQPIVMEQIRQKSRQDILFRKKQVGRWVVLRTLIMRNVKNMVRNPLLMRAKVTQGVFLSLFAGGLFFRVGTLDMLVVSNWLYLTGFLFFVSINAFTTSLSPTSITFPLQRPVFLKQQDSKMYTITQYSISRFLIDIPQILIISILNVIILYFMCYLSQTTTQFFIFYLTYFLLNLAGSSVGLLLGSVIFDAKSVATVVPIVLLPLILFSGFFVNSDTLPQWIGWIQYVSPVKYGFIAFVINQVGNQPSLINTLSFDVGMWPSIFILLGLGLGYRVISGFCLWALKTKLQ